MRRSLWMVWAAVGLLAAASPASAQDDPDKQPIGIFAADVRGVWPRFKQDPNIATAIAVTKENLPTHGLGAVVGAHVYPFRMGVVTFGFGAEMLVARAKSTLEQDPKATTEPPTVKTRFSAFSPQISFNFGKRSGFSYISGGIGKAKYIVEREDTPLPDDVKGTKTINYGGGARWFAKDHLAFSVDLRFYAVNPRETTATAPGMPRQTLMMLSGGISFK